MKPIYSAAILLLLILGFGSSAIRAEEGKTTITRMPNGLRVIVREGHTVNLVAVDIWIKAGSVNEDDSNNGISHLTEHMVFKSTKKYVAGEIDKVIEGIGAELNGGTSNDWVHFYTTVSSEYFSTALDVLAEALSNALFLPEEIEVEKRIVLDEIADDNSDPLHVAVNVFNQTAFGDHPYRLPPEGSGDKITRLTSLELVEYYNKHYVPSNTIISIAGDITKDEALVQVRRAFSGYNRPGVSGPKPAPASISKIEPEIRRFKWHSSQACIVLGFPAPPASEFRDMCALDLALSMLGNTYRGRIYRSLTKQKTKFSTIRVDYVAHQYPTMFYVLVMVDPSDKDKAAPILLSEFRKLTKVQATASELKEAKSRAEGSDLYVQETFSGQARMMGMYETIAVCDLALKYGPTIRMITAKDVMSAAEKYFSGENYVVIEIEPAEAETICEDS